MNSGAADFPLPMPTGGGGGAAPADSGADASVRLAGRTASTQLVIININGVWPGRIRDHIRKFVFKRVQIRLYLRVSFKNLQNAYKSCWSPMM